MDDLSMMREMVIQMNESLETFINLSGNLGAVGLVFWLMVRMTSHTLPKITKSLEVALATQSKTFERILDEQRTFFKERMDAEHAHGEQMSAILKANGDERLVRHV